MPTVSFQRVCCGFEGVIKTRTVTFRSTSVFNEHMIVTYDGMAIKRHVSLLFPMLSCIQACGPDFTLRQLDTEHSVLSLRYTEIPISYTYPIESDFETMYQINNMTAPKLADLMWGYDDRITCDHIHRRETKATLQGTHPRLLGLHETMVDHMTMVIRKDATIQINPPTKLDTASPILMGYLYLGLDGGTVDWDVVTRNIHTDIHFDPNKTRVINKCESLANHMASFRVDLKCHKQDLVPEYDGSDVFVIRQSVIHNLIKKGMDDFSVHLPTYLRQ